MEKSHDPAAVTNAIQDVGLIGLSIAAAILLARSGALSDILSGISEAWIFGAFISGMFFTSIFTTAPAIAVLLTIMDHQNIWMVALIGSLGSLVADSFMFLFARDRLTTHLETLLAHEMHTKRLAAIFRMRMFRYLTFFVGAIIIASPLPDELGVALLGFSRINTRYFAPLSFLANFVGIAAIGLFAHA